MNTGRADASSLKMTEDGQYLLPGDLVSQLTGLNVNTLVNWRKRPDPPPYVEGQGYPAGDLGEWIRNKQVVRKGRAGRYEWLPPGVVIVADQTLPSGGEPKKDLNTERIRREAATADKIEMENQVASGALVRSEDVQAGWADILSRVKTRMMRVPFAAAQVVVGDDDLVSVQKKISDFVRDALNEMSADWKEDDHDD